MNKYTYSINAYLNILGDFDRDKIKAIESRLLTSLQALGISKSRYERIKYSRGGLKMSLEEANAIYDFFHSRFITKLKSIDDDRQKVRLQAWAPSTINDLYYSPEAVRMGL